VAGEKAIKLRFSECGKLCKKLASPSITDNYLFPPHLGNVGWGASNGKLTLQPVMENNTSCCAGKYPSSYKDFS
jgi:hypothetical protein